MSLSVSSYPFFSCSSSYNICKRNEFLSRASLLFSSFDCNLFTEMVCEWESSIFLEHCFSKWQEYIPKVDNPCYASLHVLSFNVRGLDLRWHEVVLLLSSLKSDIIILLETGNIDLYFYEKIFNNFCIFFQRGENKNGGVLILVKQELHVSRIECKLPNVCVIEIRGDEMLRIVGVYAPASKSWSWDDLSSFLSQKCVVFGDFNVDLIRDGRKAEIFHEWADSNCLAPCIPDASTSRRADRVIDYALVSGVNLSIQVYGGNTTSDHMPISSVISDNIINKRLGKNTHWKVFSLFSEFTFSFWEKRWDVDDIDSTYNDYSRFLFLLSARCTSYFPFEKYRASIPIELRSSLSYIRAISFRQRKTKCVELKKKIYDLKRVIKIELKKFFSSQLSSVLSVRNTSSPTAVFFWSKCKKFIKPSSSSIHAFISPGGVIEKDTHKMCEIAADFYESFFKKSNIVKPHPYTDAPLIDFDNVDEVIPEVSIDELIFTVQSKRKKKSLDAHGLNNFMFNYLDLSYWTLLLKLYNKSFQSAVFPTAWKDTRMILLAKKEAICSPSLTRPISLIDSFLKIGERLFLSRFRNVLFRRGLLPDNQSGFRDGFRLQTRLLLFLEDIYSLLANSAPICTIFVDFRSAFDQLWHDGCIGKLRRLGIPFSYLNWIDVWLRNRKGFIEINNKKSRWFMIEKGGPQGSVLTPTVFISYHCDMGQFLSRCTSHFFADDVAAIFAGQLGVRYTEQCLDLEKRIKSFLLDLEYYSQLADQPLNHTKTEAMFSTRAIRRPSFNIKFEGDEGEDIKWKSEYKYLGYIISCKIGWGKLIKHIELKVRKRVSLIRSFKIFGCSSPHLRKTLFYSYVLPIFTWIFPIFPLLTVVQRNKLSHFYYTSLRRTLFCLEWSDSFFSFVIDEPSLEDRCASYWNRYLISLSDSMDGFLLFEKANLSVFRMSWLDKEFPIVGLYRSKRFISQYSVLEKTLKWLSSIPLNSSVPLYELNDLEILKLFPETFT